jgi:hypothetical protein
MSAAIACHIDRFSSLSPLLNLLGDRCSMLRHGGLVRRPKLGKRGLMPGLEFKDQSRVLALDVSGSRRHLRVSRLPPRAGRGERGRHIRR